MELKSRNPIARANRLVNRPKVVKAKKGKGAYNRQRAKREGAKQLPLPVSGWYD